MRKVILIVFFQVLVLFVGNAQKVVVKGNAKSYAGDILQLKCYEDQITLKEKVLAEAKVNAKGDFLFKLNIPETLQAFIHLNVFKGVIFIEPGKEYEIVLPQKVNKLPEDELNPFFEESEFFIRQLNAGDQELTELIKSFNRQFDNYTQKYFKNFKGKLNKSITDSIIQAIENNFTSVKNSFFTDYKNYNYFSLRLMAYERNNEKLITEAFSDKPVLLQNPAYMDLFNQLFSNYLSVYAKTDSGKMLPYYIVKEQSPEKIKQCIANSNALQDEKLQELIICKSLYENFYKDDFPKDAIITIIDSIGILSKHEEIRVISANLLEKIRALQVSYAAPDFELPDTQGKLQSLSQSAGKFIYLSFINPNSYTCQQELEVIKRMYDRNIEMLELITICICSDIDEMKKLVNKGKYTWKFLFFQKNLELLREYNIRVYPTYFLIDPESKIVMAPAFPPTEPSFEARYFDILKEWKKKLELRKNKGLQH